MRLSHGRSAHDMDYESRSCLKDEIDQLRQLEIEESCEIEEDPLAIRSSYLIKWFRIIVLFICVIVIYIVGIYLIDESESNQSLVQQDIVQESVWIS